MRALASHNTWVTVKPSARADRVSAIKAVLDLPDAELDYARAKLAFDQLIDPSLNADAVLAELDGIAVAARKLAGPTPSDAAKLTALRRLIYEGGPWNDWRPFEYDHDRFKDLDLKLLHNYLATRRGNCVSMPILFLILADRLGLDVALARAPAHLFVRHHESGRITNLETTSGALPARDLWMCQTRHVSRRGIESGFYMRSLSRRQGVGAMAMTVVEYLMGQQRRQEAIAVAQLLARNDPTDAFSLAHQGQAHFEILKHEFLDKYRSALLIPPQFRAQYLLLLQRNHAAFNTAKELGWESIP